MSDVTPVIAIVDDDQAMREAIFDLLQVAGYSARMFDSATAFLSDFVRNDVDVLITDLRMPGMDGRQLQRRLSELAPLLPIIFISGSFHANTRKAVEAAGAVAFLNKPIRNDTLLGILKRLLDNAGAAGGENRSEG